MEFLLQCLLKSQMDFLQVLRQRNDFSDFEIGLLLAIDQKSVGSDLIFLKTLRKVFEKNESQGVIFHKYLVAFSDVVQGVKNNKTENLLDELLDELEFIGKNAEKSFGDCMKKCYMETKELFMGKAEIFKVLSIFKGNKVLDDDVPDSLLNREQMIKISKALGKNLREDEVAEACNEMLTLANKLEKLENEIIHEAFLAMFIYLCDFSAMFSHARTLNQIFEKFKVFLKNVHKDRVQSAFQRFCGRVKWDVSQLEKKSEKSRLSELESKILQQLENASNEFISNNSIDCIKLRQELSKIDYKPSPKLLNKIISDMIYFDQPSAENFKFWSQILEAIKTLPEITKSNFSELKSLHSKLSIEPHTIQKKLNRPEKKPAKAEKLIVPQRPSIISSEYQTLSAYFSELSLEALQIIKENSATQSILEEITEATKQVRTYLKSYSSTCSVKFIGSAAIGTYIKDSSIDILVVDTLNSPLSYFPSLSYATLVSDSCFLLNLPKCKYSFCAHLSNLLQTESSLLVKKYCQVDARINELIIFVKIWAKMWKLTAFNGFHWTLLTLVFVINTDPSLVPSLQAKKHGEKIVNGFDIWFDSEFSQSSQNYWSLGELIFHFFSFFSENQQLVANLKTGKFLESDGKKFVALHPFTDQSLSQGVSPEDLDLTGNSIIRTFELFIKNESILKILNIN